MAPYSSKNIATKESRNDLFSIEIEQTALASLIQYPKYISDYFGIIKSDFFESKVHSVIYSSIIALFFEKGDLDKNLLVEKVRNLGITNQENIPIFDYIVEVLAERVVSEASIDDYFREIYKLYKLRQAKKAFELASRRIHEMVDRPIEEIFPSLEAIAMDACTVDIEDSYTPVDIFGTMQDEIEARANAPQPDGILTGYPEFDKRYGGLRFKQLYIIAAPRGMGKSAFVNFTGYQAAKIAENNVKVLVLDTELTTKEVQDRNASFLSGVKEIKISRGTYIKNMNERAALDRAFREANKLRGKVHHIYVENKEIDEIVSIAKRWFYLNVEEGENCLIVYDYFKLTENVNDAWSGSQVLGTKVDKIKKLVAELPRTTALAAVQLTNAGNVAMSEKMSWYASNVYQLTPKTEEQLQEYGTEFGTHNLFQLKARSQGEEAPGPNPVVITELANGEKKVQQDYINFELDNFRFKEKGTLRDIVKRGLRVLPLSESGEDADIF